MVFSFKGIFFVVGKQGWGVGEEGCAGWIRCSACESRLWFSRPCILCVCVILIPRQCSAERAGPAEKCKHLLPQVPEEREGGTEPIAFPWIVSLIWRRKGNQ